MKWLALCTGLLVSGCATLDASSVGGASFCQIAKPIRWSKEDTRMTKEQADIHNRTGKALCGWGKK